MGKYILPSKDSVDSLGSSIKRWLKGFFKDVQVSGVITDGINTVSVQSIKTTTSDVFATPAGQLKVTCMYVDSITKKLIVKYDDVPV